MGVFTMQHWRDVDRGLAEVLRVTRARVVFMTLDLDVTAEPRERRVGSALRPLRQQATLDVGLRLVRAELD